MLDLNPQTLRKLNSLTKYPSIPTYHALGERGRLTDEVQVAFDPASAILTEKIDGTNARIILLPAESGPRYLLGSREELLYAAGDLIGNPALGIVEALRPVAERIGEREDPSRLTTCYLEVYGGRVTPAAKAYTASQQVGYRLFDVGTLHDYEELLAQDLEAIARWRESRGPAWLGERDLDDYARTRDLALTPRIGDGATLPPDPADTLAYLRERLGATHALLDGAPGRAEGIVARTADRSRIAKLRFEDYERTLKAR